MGYAKINNLYRSKDILKLDEVYALEKVHGTSANISVTSGAAGEPCSGRMFSGGIKHDTFVKMMDERYPGVICRAGDLLLSLMIKGTITFYGEAYGGSCQKMSDVYGPLNFVAFEVCINDTFLDVPTAEKYAIEVGLPFVHYERGPATLAWLTSQRDKESTQAIRNGMGHGKESEGVVIRPITEMKDQHGSRIMAKFKREGFREMATAREITEDKLKILEDAEEVANEWVTEMRLTHVLDKMAAAQQGAPLTVQDTKEVIGRMISDIEIEGEGEIVWSPQVKRAIGNKTAKIFKELLNKELQNATV